MKIGVIVATDWEARCLTKRRLTPLSPFQLNEHIIVILSGMGADKALEAAQSLHEQDVDLILSCGVCAGLTDNVQSGHVIIAKQISHPEYPTIEIQPTLVQWAQNQCPQASVQPIIQAHKIITDAQDKLQFSKTQCAALDMESYTIAKFCQDHQHAFLSIRVVFDPVQFCIPPALNQIFGHTGKVHLWKLCWLLCRKPSTIKALCQMVSYAHHAKKQMRIIAAQCLQQSPVLSLKCQMNVAYD